MTNNQLIIRSHTRGKIVAFYAKTIDVGSPECI